MRLSLDLYVTFPNPSFRYDRILGRRRKSGLACVHKTISSNLDVDPIASRNRGIPPRNPSVFASYLRHSFTMSVAFENNNLQEQEPKSGLIALLTGIEIEGEIGGGRRENRYVVVNIDDKMEWKSKKISNRSPLHWQEEHRLWFRPSSSIQGDIFRKAKCPSVFCSSRLLGHFSGKVIDVLADGPALDFIDRAGTKTAVKVKLKLVLVSDPARDTMQRVDESVVGLKSSGASSKP